MIKPTTRAKIKGFLEGFLETQIEKHVQELRKETEKEAQYRRERRGELKPFHFAILPTVVVSVSSFERSFSTSLGTTFEECAKLIALDNHAEAERGKKLEGRVSRESLEEIDKIRARIDKGHKVAYPAAVKTVVDANKKEEVEIQTITDVYFKTEAGREYFFEIKSPKPNKGQGIEVTERLLKTHVIRKSGPPKVNTFMRWRTIRMEPVNPMRIPLPLSTWTWTSKFCSRKNFGT